LNLSELLRFPITVSSKKGQAMVILKISVNAHSSKRNELLSAFRLIADQTMKEKGCLDCRLSQDIDNENFINLEETWERRSDLDEHFRSDVFSALLGAAKLLGETHEIRISDGPVTEGMEAVQKARSKKGGGE
jgi:quinol monooxygenase YgiN